MIDVIANEVFDSTDRTMTERQYEKEREFLWREFPDALNQQPTQLARMEFAVALLGSLLDDPRIPVAVILESLGQRTGGASC